MKYKNAIFSNKHVTIHEKQETITPPELKLVDLQDLNVYNMQHTAQ